LNNEIKDNIVSNLIDIDNENLSDSISNKQIENTTNGLNEIIIKSNQIECQLQLDKDKQNNNLEISFFQINMNNTANNIKVYEKVETN